MAAQRSVARWAVRLLGLAALIGAVVILASPVAVPALQLPDTMIACGSGISMNVGQGDYAGTCAAAVGDRRMLSTFVGAFGVLVLMSRAKWVLSPAVRAPHRDPGRPDWVTAGS